MRARFKLFPKFLDKKQNPFYVSFVFRWLVYVDKSCLHPYKIKDYWADDTLGSDGRTVKVYDSQNKIHDFNYMTSSGVWGIGGGVWRLHLRNVSGKFLYFVLKV